MRLAVCIPVFDDWLSATTLLERLDAVASELDGTLDILYVDDGSTERLPEKLQPTPIHLGRVSILRLRRNLGHQRAIAIGLTHIYEQDEHDAVFVMDGDGEDDPQHLLDLLEQFRELGGETAIFAKRTKRVEGLMFRLGYIAFKVIHRIMTGHKVEIGNFSLVPRSILARLVGVSEMWNHYAAAVSSARISMDTIPLPRAQRIAGESKMNVMSLVAHGLGAISVFGDLVGVRLLCMTGGAILLSFSGMAIVAGVQYETGMEIPAWASSTMGLLLLTLVNLAGISIALALFVLKSRSQDGFMPIRDYRHFILEELRLRDAGS